MPAAPALPSLSPSFRFPVSNLAQRILTALVGAVVVTAAVWLGGWVFGGLMAVVAVVGQAELYGLCRKAGADPVVPLGLAFGALAALAALVPAAPVGLILGTIAIVVATLYRTSETPLLDAGTTLFGIAYPAALVGTIVRLRVSEAAWLGESGAFWLTVALFFCVWGADSFAYIAGRLFGAHPLFPRVSPKKTWEGAVGGALGALALAAGFKTMVLDDVLGWADVGVVALACGVVAPFGDLAESLFKRSTGTKDSATWLPGHGGMLDRIDAAVVAVPLVVIYLDAVYGL